MILEYTNDGVDDSNVIISFTGVEENLSEASPVFKTRRRFFTVEVK